MFREVRSFFVRRCCSAKQFAQDPQQSTGDTGLAQQLEQGRNEKRHEDTPFPLVWEPPGKWGSGKNTARMRPGLLEMVSGPGVRLFLPPVLLLKLRKKGTIKMTKKLRAGLSGRRSRKAGKHFVFRNQKTTGSKHGIFHAEDSFL